MKLNSSLNRPEPVESLHPRVRRFWIKTVSIFWSGSKWTVQRYQRALDGIEGDCNVFFITVDDRGRFWTVIWVNVNGHGSSKWKIWKWTVWKWTILLIKRGWLKSDEVNFHFRSFEPSDLTSDAVHFDSEPSPLIDPNSL